MATKSSAFCFSLLLTLLLAPDRAAPAAETPGSESVAATFLQLPIHFEKNEGQVAQPVRYLARGAGYQLFLTPGDIVLSLGPSRSALRMKLLGGAGAPAIEGGELLPGRTHYFIGSDPTRWRTDIPQYGRVTYRGVYPGIDLAFYGTQGRLEYDFIVAPGADPSLIRLAFEGAESLRLDDNGSLLLGTGAGPLIHHVPVVFQDSDGSRTSVPGRYVVVGTSEVRFELGDYDRSRSLSIDPVLTFSTYLGGSGHDTARSIKRDGSGNLYLAGESESLDFAAVGGPKSPGSMSGNSGGFDAFVTKINAAGTVIVYNTFIGGSLDDSAWGLTVDAAGVVTVAGWTASTSNFPTAGTNLRLGTPTGVEGFIARLSADGNTLSSSTYLGGDGDDYIFALAADSTATPSYYVAGETSASGGFVLVSPVDGVFGAPTEGFAMKFNNALGAITYSTFLGGGAADTAWGIAADASGNAYITGVTSSTDFPTASAYLANQPGDDAFLTKINAAGPAISYSTYLGGGGNDTGYAVAIDTSNRPHVVGTTTSTNFPMVNAKQPLIASTAASLANGYGDAFVTKFLATGASPVYSTYLGGDIRDEARAVAVDSSGNAYVTGQTNSTNFPTIRAYQATKAALNDTFVTKLDSAGSRVSNYRYSTLLGGNYHDEARAITIDNSGNAWVTGRTNSSDYPTVGALKGTNTAGVRDAFIAKLVPMTVAIASQVETVPDDTVTWTYSGGPAGALGTPYFRLLLSQDNGAFNQILDWTTATTHSESGLLDGTYRLLLYGSPQAGAQEAAVYGPILVIGPEVLSLSVSQVPGPGGTVTLTFTTTTSPPGYTPVYFRTSRSQNGGPFVLVSDWNTTNPLALGGLTAGSTYRFLVEASTSATGPRHVFVYTAPFTALARPTRRR